MTGDVGLVDEVLKRLDRSSPDKLLRSIAAEIARAHEAVALCNDRLAAIEAGAVAPPPEAPRFVALDAERDFSAMQGFHQLELSGDGLPMRWTGPGAEFQFEFTVARETAAPFALRFLKFYAPSKPLALRAEVDGVEIAVALEPQRVGGFVARGELPPRAERGPTVLRFACPKTRSPRDDGFDDDRVLGLLFLRLEVGVAESAAGEMSGASN
ncbi:hypothetical protein GGD83_000311 [Rhodoblastus sphagnicola]|nr:hypothetical protein [Rhodoblastus sphagnicola]MBB4196540.1 hypothetical protein [Rhodoblastus sphagnicola]